MPPRGDSLSLASYRFRLVSRSSQPPALSRFVPLDSLEFFVSFLPGANCIEDRPSCSRFFASCRLFCSSARALGP